jgi:hypothetical protein
MEEPRQLPVPDQVDVADDAFELARLWVANQALHVTLQSNVWQDPATWGVMLVDLARHVARAYAQLEGRDPQVVLERIQAGFQAEFEKQTSKAAGAPRRRTAI